MGTLYARTIVEGDLRWRAEVVAVCDRDAARAADLASRCGAPSFDTVSVMLESTALDMVYLAVPDHLHRDPFLACMAAGVPCLVEKPLATTMPDALAMQAAAREAGVLAEVNFSNRANPVFVRMREAVAAGDIGEVVGVNARLSNIVAYPTAMLPWASSTTCGWFLLSHVFDLAGWLTGSQAVDVHANAVKGRLVAEGVDTFDIIQALVRYERGFAGLYESAWVLPDSLPSPVDFKFQIVGSHGALYADTQDQMVHVATASAYTYPSTLNWTPAQLSGFLDRLAAPPAPGDPLVDGLNNTALLLALHKAIEQDGPVRVTDVDTIPQGAAR
jgi:predicted dehydrogenase